MYFYERETNTIIAQPPSPSRTNEVCSRGYAPSEGYRGDPVGSPYEFINHTGQTEALRSLGNYLPDGPSTLTSPSPFHATQTVESDFAAVRDGLYGRGVQKHLGEEFPAKVDKFFDSSIGHPDLAT